MRKSFRAAGWVNGETRRQLGEKWEWSRLYLRVYAIDQGSLERLEGGRALKKPCRESRGAHKGR